MSIISTTCALQHAVVCWVTTYDVSLNDLVEIVLIFKTSPSSSKSESGCSSYARFGFQLFAGISRPEIPVVAHRKFRPQKFRSGFSQNFRARKAGIFGQSPVLEVEQTWFASDTSPDIGRRFPRNFRWVFWEGRNFRPAEAGISGPPELTPEFLAQPDWNFRGKVSCNG